jgi:hypothetical protein
MSQGPVVGPESAPPLDPELPELLELVLLVDPELPLEPEPLELPLEAEASLDPELPELPLEPGLPLEEPPELPPEPEPLLEPERPEPPLEPELLVDPEVESLLASSPPASG